MQEGSEDSTRPDTDPCGPVTVRLTRASCPAAFVPRCLHPPHKGCLDTKHAGVGLALHHAVVASVAGFAGPLFVGALVQRTGSFGSVSNRTAADELQVALFWGEGGGAIHDLRSSAAQHHVALCKWHFHLMHGMP